MNEFEIGSKAVLKSGGPVMTINEIKDKELNMYYCVWFVDRILHTGLFNGNALDRSY